MVVRGRTTQNAYNSDEENANAASSSNASNNANSSNLSENEYNDDYDSYLRAEYIINCLQVCYCNVKHKVYL